MAYIGSCPDMCPERERQNRLGHNVSIFERDHDNQPDLNAMIKEYRRSGADQEEPAPEDLRTIRALERTLHYLVCNIMDDSRSKTQELALEWYDFLWDRLRAIRKDITQQNICDPRSAALVERCARFHVHSCYAMNRVKDFDVDMNKRNLNDCLQMLRQMYHDLRTTTGTICDGELEFQKYDILLHLNEDHLASTVLMKYSDYRSSSEMRFITKVFNSYTNNDYYKFFQLLRQADYMTSCVLSLFANKMRLIGLRAIINACATRQPILYPSELAINILGFDDDDDLNQFLTTIGIETQNKDDKLHILLTKDSLSLLRGAGSEVPPFKSRCLVENKMQGQSVGLLVQKDLTWFEDEQPVAADDFESGYMEAVDLPADAPDVVRQPFKINDLNATDVAAYHVRAAYLLGEVESEPTNVRIDLSMKPQDEPLVTALPERLAVGPETVNLRSALIDEGPPAAAEFASTILSAPEQIVTGPGSKPQIEAEVSGNPAPELVWLKDSQPLGDRDLRSGHLEVVDLPADKPDTVQQALKIDDTRATDMADNEMLMENSPDTFVPESEVFRAMPAGFFKVRSLTTAQPTLRLPPRITNEPEAMPVKRYKQVNSLQRKLDSISMSIEEEKEANLIFSQLTHMLSQ